jgi:hypothetical protein
MKVFQQRMTLRKLEFGEIITCHQFGEHQKKEEMLARRLRQCPGKVYQGPGRCLILPGGSIPWDGVEKTDS